MSPVLLAGAAVVVMSSCDQTEAPTSTCDLECGEHGACAVVLSSPRCVCDEGYQGEACDACAPGFVDQAGECVPDPCAANPCQAPHQSICQVTDTGFECLCDDDAQDNDGDGTCRPACSFFADSEAGQACDDSSGEALLTGPRSCESVVRFRSDDPALTSVNIAGEFNDWRQDQPMTQLPDGTFEARLTLAAGDYAYKFYLPGGDAWIEDPSNPYTKYDAGIRNSRLRVPSCEKPRLRLLHTPDVAMLEGDAQGQVRFKVQYIDGSQAAGLSPQGVVVTRNGAPVTSSYDAALGVLTIDDGPLPVGKYAYRLDAGDVGGRVADQLYVPVWVEASRFEWEDAVMYFVFTDRFLDGNPGNNSPVPEVPALANWMGGDFAGLRQKIESGYFEDLGVNALWISSISHNTGGAGAGVDGRQYTGYHSYWPISTGWTGDEPLEGVQPVDPHFGTMDEFKALVELAHSKGIRVLVDFVANHVHTDSPLWQAHQFDNPAWFHVPAQVCEDIGWSLPIECWFAGYLPDFEYRNLDVMKRVADHAVWMVKETDIDGFRLDAVKHMIDDFTTTLRGRVDEEITLSGQRFYMVGETFTGEDGAEELKRYIGPDKLDGQFDFPLFWQVTAVFLRQERDLRALEGMLRWSEGFYGDFAVMSTFLGNHDVCRAVGHANGDFGDLFCNGGKEQGWSSPPGTPGNPEPYEKLRQAWTFMMTAPGIPLIYYGDEFGMPGAGDPDNRRMMLFDEALNAEQQATKAHVARLSQIRREHRALRYGQRSTLQMSDDGLAWVYALKTVDDVVIVAINRADGPRTLTIDTTETLNSSADPVEALGALPFDFDGASITIEVPARGSAVFTDAARGED